jgi:hypothetical protein
MSVEFGNAIEKLLLDNAGVNTALPGGITFDYRDPSQDPNLASAVYRVQTSTRPRSLSGFCGHREVTIGLEFFGAGPSEAQNAYNAIEAVIEANEDQGVITVSYVRVVNGSNTTVQIKVNNLEIGTFQTTPEQANDGSGNQYIHFTTTISGDLIL